MIEVNRDYLTALDSAIGDADHRLVAWVRRSELAQRGRASYLGPRSVGHKDPGAASTALLLRALVNVVDSETRKSTAQTSACGSVR